MTRPSSPLHFGQQITSGWQTCASGARWWRSRCPQDSCQVLLTLWALVVRYLTVRILFNRHLFSLSFRTFTLRRWIQHDWRYFIVQIDSILLAQYLLGQVNGVSFAGTRQGSDECCLRIRNLQIPSIVLQLVSHYRRRREAVWLGDS